MAYRITYGPPVPQQYQKKDTPLRLQVLTAVCLLLFILMVKTWFPTGTKALRHLLLPEPSSATQQALDRLVTDLRDGDPLGDAFTAFCQHIIDHDETISG